MVAAKVVGIILLLVLLMLALRRVIRLPENESGFRDVTNPVEGDTTLSQAIEKLAGYDHRKTGVLPLIGATESLALRLALIDAADKAIDLQYYIWRRDLTGLLVFNAVQRAANRGVKVRLLLDDNGSSGLDDLLGELADHSNIEVRLFNPFPLRRLRWLCYFFEFVRLNRRMHNKSFTIDSAATIIGGRNIADAYFEAGRNYHFVDLDVLAVGKAVKLVSNDFDRYWHSKAAYPVDVLTGFKGSQGDLLSTELVTLWSDDHHKSYKGNLARHETGNDLLASRLDLQWTDVDLVSDDPDKSLGLADFRNMMFPKLTTLLGRPRSSVDLASPYLVPGRKGLAQYAALARNGVKIRILTNSMAATDVAAVHAGYAKYRRRMLQAGIELFEMKPETAPVLRPQRGRITGSATSSLHAKTFAVDDRRVYVGSFNFDLRSILLNTEMGFVIDSPELAGDIRDAFDANASRIAYRPFLRENGRMAWAEVLEDGEVIVHNTEPKTGPFQRGLITLIGKLPVEWLL